MRHSPPPRAYPPPKRTNPVVDAGAFRERVANRRLFSRDDEETDGEEDDARDRFEPREISDEFLPRHEDGESDRAQCDECADCGTDSGQQCRRNPLVVLLLQVVADVAGKQRKRTRREEGGYPRTRREGYRRQERGGTHPFSAAAICVRSVSMPATP